MPLITSTALNVSGRDRWNPASRVKSRGLRLHIAEHANQRRLLPVGRIVSAFLARRLFGAHGS